MTRSPDRMLDEIAQSRGRSAALRRKLALNKESNWLLALMLNSYSKFSQGLRLTNLEQLIVDTSRRNGLEDLMRVHARLNERMPRELRSDIFAGQFAEVNPTTAYTLEDLGRDAPAIARAIVTKPNVTVADVEAIHAGRRDVRDFPRPSRQIQRDYGLEGVIAVEPIVDPPNPRFTIKAEQFYCIERAGDALLDPNNEPFWLFGTVAANGTFFTSVSHDYEGIYSHHPAVQFPANEGWLWAKGGAAADLPDVDLGCSIQLVEHDAGNTDQARTAFTVAFAIAEGLAKVSGAASWLAGLLAAVATVVDWILGAMDDDPIDSKYFVFNRQMLTNQLKKSGDYKFYTREFTDEDAYYLLQLKVTRS